MGDALFGNRLPGRAKRKMQSEHIVSSYFNHLLKLTALFSSDVEQQFVTKVKVLVFAFSMQAS